MNSRQEEIIEEKLIQQLDHHLNGLKEKINNDFNQEAFNIEINALKSDSLYKNFHLASKEYALIRLMGRISVSIGRRLGEIYDKIPRLIAQYAFDIPEDRIAPKMGGKLELDICLPFDVINQRNRQHINEVIKKYADNQYKNGVGIEIRYNFNPNDSSRLRKDVDMVKYLIDEKLTPIYMIYSSISPRDEAIARLKRAGWQFVVGEAAFNFSKELFKIDISKVFEKNSVNSEIKIKIKEIMETLFLSYAFQQIVNKYYN